MKKVFIYLLVFLLAAAGIVAWLMLGPATSFSESRQYLFVYTGKANEAEVMRFIIEKKLVKHPDFFEFAAGKMDVWTRLRPGRYEIEKGESILNIARTLRNHNQSPVNFVIKKLRTNEDLAGIIGKNFEADSVDVLSFINSSDSLDKLKVDEHTLMSLVIPNTYTLFWNSTPGRVLRRLKSEKEDFWKKNNRMEKAKDLGFTPAEVSTIASIVEEETNMQDEKGNVASVYINRYRAGMKLGADPTIKFALKDFGLRRIYFKQLDVVSPYNTYRNAGLPPGPICTPSPKTIDAVLNSPRTDYMFFVARKDFSGYHTFSNNYAEHMQHAKEYQKALDEWLLRKQNAAKPVL